MSMLLTVPDDLVRQLEAVAAARGASPSSVALEALASSPMLAGVTVGSDDDLLEAFLGGGRSDGTRPTEIHEMRRELAERRAAEGIENL